MSAKMNRDRVRKETQTRRSGSEWIGSDAVGNPTVLCTPPRCLHRKKDGTSPNVPSFLFLQVFAFVGARSHLEVENVHHNVGSLVQ